MAAVAFDLFVQEGCVPEHVRPEVARMLEAACRETFGPAVEDFEISWTEVAAGYGFRGGKPSTTSLVRGRIPDGCEPPQRAFLLRTIGDSWCRIVGATEEEVVVSLRDWSWKG